MDTAQRGRDVRRRAPVVPNQHGAWGFLALPVLLGVVAAGWSWELLPLTVAWVAAYPLSWAVTGTITARRPERFRRALFLWAGIALPAGLVALVLRPWLVWVLAGFLVLFAVSLAFARARNERALANDLVLVAQCTAMVPVTAASVSNEVLALTLVCALTLVGSTLHVKSLIRERNDPRYTAAAQVFAVACVPVVVATGFAADLSLWLAVPFVALAARAVFWHDPTWRPARIGLVELGGLVAVLAGAALSR